MEKIRKFAPADRYVYDFGACSPMNGFAQIDTWQDASYYGTWANPERLIIFCYCEGDCTTTTCDNVQEFISEIHAIKDWCLREGEKKGFLGIDPGLNPAEIQKWKDIGLEELIY